MSVEIVVTDRTGTQGRFLPMQRVDLDGCSFSYRSDGGMTQGTLATSLTLAEAGHIAPGDRVEVRIGGVLFWRGYVDDPSLSRADLQTASFSVYGAWNYALRTTMQQRYLKPGGVDVSVFFADIIQGWVLPLFPSMVVQADTVGVLKDREDAWGRPVRDVLGELRDWAGADTVFGSDVVDSAFGDDITTSFGYGQDRLFLRQAKDPTASGFVPDFAEFTPGPRGGTAGKEIRSSEVVNALYFIGGPREFPNVFPSDMETPLAAGQGVGNLIQDAGFESRDNWTLYGGASYKTAGLTEGNAYAGANMLETDHVGEGASEQHTGPGDPSQDVTPGHTYEFGAHVRQTQGADLNQGTVTLTWLDSSHADMAGPASFTVQPPSAGAWEFYSGTAVCPTGATGWRVNIEMTVKSGDGLMWDEIELVDQTTIYMNGVEAVPYGDAKVVGQNWTVEGDPYGEWGAYSHIFQVTATDSDGHDVHIQPRGKARAQCLANQELTFSIPMKLPAGAPSSPKMLLEIEFYDSSGKSVSHPKHTVSAGALTSSWQLLHTSAQAPSSAVYVCAWLTIRGSGTIEADAFCLRDSSTDVSGAPAYVPTGPLVARFHAADFPELTTAQRASESLYGYREPNQAYTSDSVILDADAYQFALNLFRQKALPPERGPFEVFAPTRPIVPGMVGRLTGPDGPLLAGSPHRVEECELRFSKGVPVLSLTMDDARPDAVRFLLDLALKRKSQSSASFASSSGGNASNPVPSPAVGDEYFGDLSHTASDSTLHDDYRTGPHLSDAEHSSIAATATQSASTAAEVTAARENAGGTDTYASLKARLDALETQGGAPAWGIQGEDMDDGGTTAFDPGDLAPTWQTLWPSPDGNLRFLPTLGGPVQPVAWQQRCVLSTRLKVATATTITVSVYTDNHARLFLNGTQIGGDATSVNSYPLGTLTFSLSLLQGWNDLRLCYGNGDGDTYALEVAGWVSGAAVPLAGLVDRMTGVLPV